ncbi:MAG: hypothetical protein U7123_14910 [Potamolinea sp.]
MVILEKTKTQLKLRHRPYTVWLVTASWMLGIILLIVIMHLYVTWLIYLWWVPLFILLNLITASLVLLFAGKIFIYHFDKTSNSLVIKQRSLINTKLSLYSITDILDIQVKSTSWNQDANADYQIAIIWKSGKDLSLNVSQSSAVTKKLETVNLIREFLGMSPQKLGW